MFYNASIDEILNNSKLAIMNAMNVPDIQEALIPYTYTRERLEEGLHLFTITQQAVMLRELRAGEQQDSTKTLKLARETAHRVYIRHVKLARIAFQAHPEARSTLGLEGSRELAFSGLLTQARQFYTNTLNDPTIVAALLPFNISLADLNAALALLDTAETAYAARQKAHAAAVQATRERNQTLQALKDWVSDLIAVARIALEDRPQLLEALGVVVRA